MQHVHFVLAPRRIARCVNYANIRVRARLLSAFTYFRSFFSPCAAFFRRQFQTVYVRAVYLVAYMGILKAAATR